MGDGLLEARLMIFLPGKRRSLSQYVLFLGKPPRLHTAFSPPSSCLMAPRWAGRWGPGDPVLQDRGTEAALFNLSSPGEHIRRSSRRSFEDGLAPWRTAMLRQIGRLQGAAASDRDTWPCVRWLCASVPVP